MDPNQQAQQTSQQAQATQDSGMTFDSSPVQQDTPVQGQDSGMTFDSAPVNHDTSIDKTGKPRFAPYSAAFSRYTTPENYEKWASTQPKSGPDSKPGEYEAWTGANTPGGAMQTLKDSLTPLPYAALAAGTALGGSALLEALPETADAAKNYILKKLAEQSPDLFGHEAVKETLKKYALEGVKKAATGAAWAGGAELLHSIWDDVFGKKK